MTKLITWLDLDGRYRITSPAYNDSLRPEGESEEECLERTWAVIVAKGGYGIPVNHSHAYVEESDLKTKTATLSGLDFRYAGKPDANGRKDGKYGAWEMDSDGTPKVNMATARGVQMDKIRVQRNAELVKKDLEALRAIEDGDTSAQAVVKAKKQELRDIPQTFDLTTEHDTPEELKAKWPEGLPK